MTDDGRYGEYGGQYVPETLMTAVNELEEAYGRLKGDPGFLREVDDLNHRYTNRPSPLYLASRMTEDLGGARVYLKREDLNHTGSHKINNVIGQCLLAKRMGKTRVIAETGAGQHGVATATLAAYLGLECEVYMGARDVERQALNVYRMELLGAKVHPVSSGSGVLKDAVNETLREWSRRVEDTHYVIGTVMGPHPYPTMVCDFQSIIGREVRSQLAEAEGRGPDCLLACVGGGSNAIGLFHEFVDDPGVRMIGCEAAGKGVDTDMHAATMTKGTTGIFHGMKSLFCQDGYGQIAPVYSISAGLDYPGIGPEHAYLKSLGRAEYVAVTDDSAVDAFEYLSRTEGIIPAIESAHAVAYARELAPTMSKDDVMVVNLSGRGDKDVAAIARYRGRDIHDRSPRRVREEGLHPVRDRGRPRPGDDRGAGGRHGRGGGGPGGAGHPVLGPDSGGPGDTGRGRQGAVRRGHNRRRVRPGREGARQMRRAARDHDLHQSRLRLRDRQVRREMCGGRRPRPDRAGRPVRGERRPAARVHRPRGEPGLHDSAHLGGEDSQDSLGGRGVPVRRVLHGRHRHAHIVQLEPRVHGRRGPQRHGHPVRHRVRHIHP